MIQTTKRIITINGVKIGLASAFNASGESFLQAAILYGNQFPIASTSLYFPTTSISIAENKIKTISDNELVTILERIHSYDSFANALSLALINVPNTHQAPVTPPPQRPVRGSYKRTVN